VTCTKQCLSFQNTPDNLYNLYVPSGLPSATCNCNIMLMPWMWIHFLLTAMALNSSRKAKWKATTRAKMPTSGINWCLSLNCDGIKGYISEYIHTLTQIYNVWGVQDERAWNPCYDIIFLYPATTRHLLQFQLMWPHRRSRYSPFREWWGAFRSYVGQMLDKTHDQITNWRWDNPRAYGDHVDCCNPWTTSLRKVKCTSKQICW